MGLRYVVSQPMRAALAVVILAAHALGGRVLSFDETTVQLRDPARVTVSTPAATGNEAARHEILPANATPVVVAVGNGSFAMGEL
jgi:hypothetical protein